MDTLTTVERLLTEDKIGLAAAGVLAGGTGGRPIRPTTVARWCIRGIRVMSVGVVRLEHFRAGGKLLTSRRAVARFLAAQSGNAGNDPIPVRSPAERNRASDRAAAELEAFGV